MTAWSEPGGNIMDDLRAAAELPPPSYQPTEYHCALGHRLVLCVGDGALVEHTKQAHPEAAAALGWT